MYEYIYKQEAAKVASPSSPKTDETPPAIRPAAPSAFHKRLKLEWLDPTQMGREAQNLSLGLRRMVVGQDEAIEKIAAAYQMHLTGLREPGRPIGNLLFLGPTGTGKTRIVEATAESLLNNPRAVIKIDCAEFQHSHEIAKLIGSPPGYLGHRETHPLLSQEVLNQYHTEKVKLSFVLFDEIEKASDAVWNLLLGILDKATLTLGDNRKVDFSCAFIFMTSNLGATEMQSILSPKVGFSGLTGGGSQTEFRNVKSKLTRSGIAAARRKFTPEFINRLDQIVTFNSLTDEQLKKILDIELNLVQQRVFNTASDRVFVFTVMPMAEEYLLKQGTDLRYGARHLKRSIERLLVQPLANLIATDQIRGGDWIRVDYEAGQPILSFHKEAAGLPTQDMSRMSSSPAAFLSALTPSTSPPSIPPELEPSSATKEAIRSLWNQSFGLE